MQNKNHELFNNNEREREKGKESKKSKKILFLGGKKNG